MTATLIGSYSLGDAIPGMNDVLNSTGTGLTALKSSVDSVIGNIGALQSELDGLANDIDTSVQAITDIPFAAVQDQLTAASGALASLEGITDAGAYLDSIIGSLTETIDLLNSVVPNDYLAGQIAAVQAAVDDLQSSVDNFQSDLDDLTSIADDVRAQTKLLGDIEDTLQTASDDALTPIIEFNAAVSQLLNSGVFAVYFSGELQNLGSEVDSVLPGTGIGNDELVETPLLVVRIANAATISALRNVFKTS